MDISQLQENASEVAAILQQLSNKNRLMIACTLMDTEMSVGELNQHINLSQSALSQHLASLRSSNLVSTRREGQTIFYRMHSEEVRQLMLAMKNIFCPD
jgi:ArsR family transcriptional regulator